MTIVQKKNVKSVNLKKVNNGELEITCYRLWNIGNKPNKLINE